MHKSIMVAVERWMILPKYNFRMKRHSKIMAHDENNECHIGDLVRIETSRSVAGCLLNLIGAHNSAAHLVPQPSQVQLRPAHSHALLG